MAKKRKTKAEKKLADQRHSFLHATAAPIFREAVIKPSLEIKTEKIQKETYANAYPYLIKDLSKTAFLSAAIIAFQIILFLILRNHIISVPGVSY